MKILYVLNSPAFFYSHRLPIALAARAAGHEVALLTGTGAEDAAEAEARDRIAGLGIEHHVVPFNSVGLNPLREWRAVVQMARVMRRWRPDVVHAASPKGLLYGGLAARMTPRTSVVLAVSGMGTLYTGGSWIRRVLRWVYGGLVRIAYGHSRKAVIVQNADDFAAILDKGLATAHELVLIPGSGVDLPPLLALPLQPRPPLVVLPARMLKDKGVIEFVEAATELHAVHPTWRFALVGGTHETHPSAIRSETLRRWESLGHVEWWGHRTDMPAVFGQARIVCLPSYREGMPKALLEAAAAGCAVVTTDTVGCREAVRPGVTGDLVPVADVAALKQALQALMLEPQRCVAYGAAGRRMAIERFGVDAVVASTLSLYTAFN